MAMVIAKAGVKGDGVGDSKGVFDGKQWRQWSAV
jgi:hypothetical protein